MTQTGTANDESRTSTRHLIEALKETRARTLRLVDDLSDEQLVGHRLQIVNPLRWEIAHIAWFQEFWVLRHLGSEPPILLQGDELYDSARVAHDTRWDLLLLGRQETLAYMQQVLDRVINQASDESAVLTDAEGYTKEYFLKLVLLHEQMHDEAITYTRQTHGYPAPTIAPINKVRLANQDAPIPQINHDLTSEAEISGGRFTLGTASGPGFAFDNEHPAPKLGLVPLQSQRPL